MAKKAETNLHTRILKALRKEFPGSWWFKVWGGPFTPAGIPDLMGCVCGLFFALEVKLPDNKRSKTSKIQDETIADLRKANAHARVVRSPQEAVDYVRSVLRRWEITC